MAIPRLSQSLSETEKLCKLAAKGAGMSWGMADEAAVAARWLATFGLPGPKMLADLLQLNNDLATHQLTPDTSSNTWSAAGDRMCPIITGSALNDAAHTLLSNEVLEFHNLTQPLLLLPFAASSALILGQSIALEWQGARLITDGKTIVIEGLAMDIEAPCMSLVKCSLTSIQSGTLATHSRAIIDSRSRSVLSGFAQTTYAPATQESRMKGAGSGANDND